MAEHVINIFDDPTTRTERRLADLPDRVVEGDPHHKVGMHFTSPDGNLSVGT